MVYLIIAYFLLSLLLICLIYINITPNPPTPPQRLISEAEIAAKSIGYWEKRGLAASDSREKSLCVRGLIKAQQKLIHLTGDYIPDEAKQIDRKVSTPAATTSSKTSPATIIPLRSNKKTD